jgi:hypothetical protein
MQAFLTFVNLTFSLVALIDVVSSKLSFPPTCYLFLPLQETFVSQSVPVYCRLQFVYEPTFVESQKINGPLRLSPRNSIFTLRQQSKELHSRGGLKMRRKT